MQTHTPKETKTHDRILGYFYKMLDISTIGFLQGSKQQLNTKEFFVARVKLEFFALPTFP